MKKTLILVVIVSAIGMYSSSCKGKDSTTETSAKQTDQSSNPGSNDNSSNASAMTNEPKTFAVSFSPDSVYLGKRKEAFVKIQNAKAVELSDADGKITGTELTYDLEVTNKNQMGGDAIYINPDEFRLQLDNGNNITSESSNGISVDPESTNSSTGNKFRLPAGTKPKALNLFYDETRASVAVDMK